MSTEEKNVGKKRLIYLILAIVCGLAALGGAIYLIAHQIQVRNAQAEYEALRASMEAAAAEAAAAATDTPQATETPEPTEEPVDLSIYDIPELTLDWDTLAEENADIYAWLYIPDTVIDYPILQHPTELDYYLKHNVDGSSGYPGCIYSQYLNAKDFSDFNTVLYGHNMNAGTMFANLHYFEDDEFFDTHPYVYVYTEDGPLVYEVFAAYAYSNLHLLMGFDLTKEEVRQTYIDNIFAVDGMTDHVRDDVEVTTDSQILTLSTCIKNKAENRYLVSCVLVADGRGVTEAAAGTTAQE